MDVDGVLTDGTFWWGANGDEYKRFSFSDIMGISIGRKGGLIFALISGEDSPIIDRYADKMGIVDLYKGCKDKAGALRSFAQKHSLDLSEICFIGDDINDVPALAIAGLAAVPADAHSCACKKAAYTAKHNGGCGAVREIIDKIQHEQDHARNK